MIKIIENTKVVAGNYIYDLNRLNYESLNESEYIYASVNGNYLALAIQIATGQESLIVIVNMSKDKIVFRKKSQFVECVKLYKNYVVSLHCVSMWGVSPYNYISLNGIDGKVIDVEVRLPYKNYGLNLDISIEDDIITITSNGTIADKIDFSSYFQEGK